LVAKGEVFTSDKDKNILQSIDMYNLINQNYKTLTLENSMENVVAIFSTSEQKIIPIINTTKSLVGIINFEDVKGIIFNPYRVKFMTIQEVINQPKAIVLLDDKIEEVMLQFKTCKVDCLPVLKNGSYFGMLAKIDLLENYRKNLKEMIIE
jgi:CIC family chloride channel protein